jgi:hypothetical protein
MRRAIVHIGTPRTATTTLQRVLFTHRAALAERGILYPDITPPGATDIHLSHQHLGEALGGRRPARERRHLLDDLDDQLRRTACDTVLLSYEGLCKMPPTMGVPAQLAALFARHGLTMQTLLTVKPQAEYLNSTYTWRMQFLREARPFAAFLNNQIGLADGDFARLLAPWQRASAGGVAVAPLRDPRSAEPLVARVFAALDLGARVAPLLGADDAALVENRSPGPLAVEICRRLRAAAPAAAASPRAREATRFIEDAARAAGEDATAFQGLDDALRARVEARWAAANERFAAAIWGEPWAARVAAAPPRPANEIARRPREPRIEALVQDIATRARASFGIAPRRFAVPGADAAAAAAAALLRHARTLRRG